MRSAKPTHIVYAPAAAREAHLRGRKAAKALDPEAFVILSALEQFDPRPSEHVPAAAVFLPEGILEQEAATVAAHYHALGVAVHFYAPEDPKPAPALPAPEKKSPRPREAKE